MKVYVWLVYVCGRVFSCVWLFITVDCVCGIYMYARGCVYVCGLTFDRKYVK